MRDWLAITIGGQVYTGLGDDLFTVDGDQAVFRAQMRPLMGGGTVPVVMEATCTH